MATLAACRLIWVQVVNALLTQLDKLRHKKNVLVVSTSNLAKAIGQLTLPPSIDPASDSLRRFGLC